MSEKLRRRILSILLGCSVLLNAWLMFSASIYQIGGNVLDYFQGPPKLLSTDYSKTSSPRAVPVVAYMDFRCPYCAKMDPVLEEAAGSGLISLTYRFFPLDFHEHSEDISVHVHCAGQQGAFWPYVHALYQPFSNDAGPSEEELRRLDSRLGLNRLKMESCLSDPNSLQRVRNDKATGQLRDVVGTPTIFVGYQRIGGYVSKEQFRSILENYVK